MTHLLARESHKSEFPVAASQPATSGAENVPLGSESHKHNFVVYFIIINYSSKTFKF